MSLFTHLQRSFASSLGRSSRADPRAIAWMQTMQGQLFSSSSDSSGSSSSESDGNSSSSDDDEIESKKPIGADQKPSTAEAKAEEVKDFFDPSEGFNSIDAAALSQPSASTAAAWEKIDGGFPASTAFHEAMKLARDMTEEQLAKMAEEEETLRRSNVDVGKAMRASSSDKERKALAKGFKPQRRAEKEDFLLLAEAIEAYLSVAPTIDIQRDGVGRLDRGILTAMATYIRSEHGDGGRSEAMPPELAIGSPLEKRVVNMAPPGRLGWEVLGVDEERAVIHFGVDLTDGKAPDPWRNAQLSEDAKLVMYQAHKSNPEKYSVEELAKIFKIRQQRVMAIVALKELEEGSAAAKTPEAEELRRMLEEQVWYCNEATGSGEKHVVTVPSYPNYAIADTAAVKSRLEAVLGKSFDEISEDDLTPEIAQQVLGVKPQVQLEEDLAAAEESTLVAEFKKALDYNLGKTGQSLSRKSVRTHAPKRPAEGWSLVVTPLGKDAKEKPYVAGPDGERRELTEDEGLLVERKTPKPRRRIL